MWKILLSKILGKPIYTKSKQDDAFSNETTKESARIKSPIEHLWGNIAHLSNKEYPFLDKLYSPGSRVPCADFAPFIIDRLRCNDIYSIRKLMRAIIAGNPGLGVGPEWIDKSVDKIAEIDFGKYFTSTNPNIQLELKALFIIIAKDGGDLEFLILNQTPLFFAYALCCYEIQLLEEMNSLIEKANLFIKRMRRNAPAWRECPLFEYNSNEITLPNCISVKPMLLAMTPLSRIHLLYFAEKDSGPLMQATSYLMRSLGINPLETSELIISSGLCESATDLNSVAKALRKDDIIAVMDDKEITYRRTWKKEQLLEAINLKAPEFVAEVANREKIARIRPEFLDEVHSLIKYAHGLERQMKLLCFVLTKSKGTK
jgi:hypothetical protein